MPERGNRDVRRHAQNSGFRSQPDDAAWHVGGLLSLYLELDFTVKMISDTDGAAGYDKMAGDDRARLN